MKAKNLDLKRELIENKKYAEWLKKRNEIYKNANDETNKMFADMTVSDERKRQHRNYLIECAFHELREDYSPLEWECMNQLRECKKRQFTELKRHAVYWYENYSPDEFAVMFVTLTFNNEALANLNEDVRRKYVASALAGSCVDYVASIDFGEENDREHYHAVVLVNRSDLYQTNDISKKNGKTYMHQHLLGLKKWCSDIGHESAKEVKKSEMDLNSTLHYLAKVCNYAIKGNDSSVIVKRGSDYKLWLIEEKERKKAEKALKIEETKKELKELKELEVFGSYWEGVEYWNSLVLDEPDLPF